MGVSGLRRKTFTNNTLNQELFLPEVELSARLLSAGRSIDGLRATVTLTPRHDLSTSNEPPRDANPRQDGYWSAFILTPSSFTCADVSVRIEPDPARGEQPPATGALDAVVLALRYVAYGPFGRRWQRQDIVLPLGFPPVAPEPAAAGGDTVPVKTHLLCHLDDPVSVARRYAVPVAQAGDVLCVAESALAVMQGRWRHPENIRPGLIARLACKLFKTTSSLATACGMQSLIDMVGRARVVFAVVVGAVARLLRIRGAFYSAAGEQSRLVDDLTGTLPPYDQYIVAGPVRSEDVAESVRRATGIETAVVDANDLGKVDVLGASSGVDRAAVQRALAPNPAGNGDQRTPLVLVRGCTLAEQ
ncbi:unnamed protein product [Pedinophyceae sp. YPF-701]|nr:unnamed protein product [Pedinophyceae sp. YPF-701]